MCALVSKFCVTELRFAIKSGEIQASAGPYSGIRPLSYLSILFSSVDGASFGALEPAFVGGCQQGDAVWVGTLGRQHSSCNRDHDLVVL